MPRDHPVTNLIVTHLHRKLKPSGTEHVLAELRQRFWVPKARPLIKKVIKQCPNCKRNNARPAPPLMASLPSSRLQPFTPPFRNTSVDCFDPLHKRSVVKRYGCLFRCLVTKAVHLEIAHSLETDSFIMALRRMISRRGKPRFIRSDHGTNFVGAEKELGECLDRLNHTKFSDTLTQDGIQWVFNPPSAPHFGGVWERMVRSAKKALKVTSTYTCDRSRRPS